MSRLENHNKKVARKRLITTAMLIAVVVFFFFNSGIALLIDGSVRLAQIFGGSKRDDPTLSAPEFGVVEIDEIPTATNSATIVVSGRALNMKKTFIYINKEQKDELNIKEDGTFSAEVELSESGENEVYVAGIMQSSDEKKVSNTYTVVYSKDRPSIEVSEPTDGLKTPRNEIKVAGSVKSSAGIAVRVNGTLSTVGQGGVFNSFVKLNEGENTVTITAVDNAGNSEEKIIKVIYEK